MTCQHLLGLDPVPARTPQGCEECLKIGHALGPSPPLPELRPRRLLRQLAGPPRHASTSTTRATR